MEVYSHDTKRKRRLEHRTLPVNVQTEAIARDGEKSQVLAVGAVPGYVGAVRVGDAAKAVHAADECANEEQVDEGDKLGRVPCARVQEESAHGPCCAEDGDDEENQDRARGQDVALVEPVDEPGEHAQGGNQGDDFEDAPEDERQARDRHFGGMDGVLLVVVVVGEVTSWRTMALCVVPLYKPRWLLRSSVAAVRSSAARASPTSISEKMREDTEERGTKV